MKSLNPTEVFRLLLKFHADFFGQFEMQFSDYMRVATLVASHFRDSSSFLVDTTTQTINNSC
jgi:hypothetical protein